MKLAFYYHKPLRRDADGNLLIPSYLGVFIDSLARCVERLCLVMHESENDYAEADYVLLEKNITWISLGKKTPAWHRAIFYRKILKGALTQIEDFDVLLIRSPSPLAPYFNKFLNNVRPVFMVVGDYSESVKNSKELTIRDWVIKYFLVYNNSLFEKEIIKTDIVVNSLLLYEKYKNSAKSIHQIRTTTLSSSDFYHREDTCNSDPIQLLYTGRIDPQKGLFELVDATALLIDSGYHVICNIVGWETGKTDAVKESMIIYANEKGIKESLVFHGRKKVGEELNAAYRAGDIYIIPSYHEGFPRTIWEAMANSLPVIATRVGSIPKFLDHTNALLIEPKDSQAIYQAVIKIIENQDLRRGLIENGQILSKENTLEQQSKKLTDILSDVAAT